MNINDNEAEVTASSLQQNKPTNPVRQARVDVLTNAARRHPALFERLAEQSDEGIYVFDREFRFVYVNQAAERIAGIIARDVIGKVLWELFPQSVNGAFYRQHMRSIGEKIRLSSVDYSPVVNRWFEVVSVPAEPGLFVYFRDIDERRRAEEGLRRYADIFQSTEQAVVVSEGDGSGNLREVNPAFARMHGYDSTDELAGKPISLAFAPEAWPDVAKHVDRASKADSYSFESVHVRKNGERFPVFVECATVRNETGNPLYRISTITDLTERKAAERKLRGAADTLRVSEERYRSLADALSEIVWNTAADGSIVPPQPGWEAFTGQSSEEIIGTGWLAAIHPEDRDLTATAWITATETRTPYHVEHRLRRHDGVYRIMNVRAIPLMYGDTIREWVGIHVDITERREAERELARRERDYAALVDNAPDILVRYDRDKRIVYINRAVEKHTGAPPDFFLGKTFAEAGFPDDVITVWNDALDHVFATGEPHRIEFAFTHPVDGTIRYYESALNPEFDDVAPFPGKTATVYRVVALSHDITERRQAEVERERLGLQQRRFLREMLFSMTEGRLRLCDGPEDLPVPLPRAAPPIALTARTLRDLRRLADQTAKAAGLPLERMQDLETAVGEAGMNAVVHGGGGEGAVCADLERGTVQIWVRDEGKGITQDALHRATLERGFTTAGTLGHGFWMMLRTADRVYLLTGPEGTTVAIEQDRAPALPVWMQTALSSGLK